MQKILIERGIPAPGRHLCGLAWDGAQLWHSDGDTNLIYQIDSTSGKVLGSIPCPDVRTDLSYDSGNLWQIAGHPKRIVVIDPRQARILKEIDLGPDRENACGLCVAGENYYVGLKQRGLIENRSLRNNLVLQEYSTKGRADGVVLAMDNLWYTDYDRSLLVGIDIKTGKELERHLLPGKPTGLCWDSSRFWYSDYANKQIRAVRLKN
jgi:peptide/nickel transport system substrate-binding protein